jgi:hypothetical protein
MEECVFIVKTFYLTCKCSLSDIVVLGYGLYLFTFSNFFNNTKTVTEETEQVTGTSKIYNHSSGAEV